jgi:hypothetical protein
MRESGMRPLIVLVRARLLSSYPRGAVMNVTVASSCCHNYPSSDSVRMWLMCASVISKNAL